MPVHTKIRGDHTRPTDEGTLCTTCRYAMIVRGTRLGDDVLHCQALRRRVTFTVVECSGYEDAGKTPVWELEKSAWIRELEKSAWIRMEDRKGKVRFISPIERAKQNLDDD